MTTRTKRPTQWCPNYGMGQSLSNGNISDGFVSCERCGKVVTIRKNVYGTPLGLARHKEPEEKSR